MSTTEIKAWIDEARWFGGKGRDWELGDVRAMNPESESG